MRPCCTCIHMFTHTCKHAYKCLYLSRFKSGVTDQWMDGLMDQQMDQRMDRPSYRDARTHLKSGDREREKNGGHEKMGIWPQKPTLLPTKSIFFEEGMTNSTMNLTQAKRKCVTRKKMDNRPKKPYLTEVSGVKCPLLTQKCWSIFHKFNKKSSQRKKRFLLRKKWAIDPKALFWWGCGGQMPIF